MENLDNLLASMVTVSCYQGEVVISLGAYLHFMASHETTVEELYRLRQYPVDVFLREVMHGDDYRLMLPLQYGQSLMRVPLWMVKRDILRLLAKKLNCEY